MKIPQLRLRSKEMIAIPESLMLGIIRAPQKQAYVDRFIRGKGKLSVDYSLKSLRTPCAVSVLLCYAMYRIGKDQLNHGSPVEICVRLRLKTKT